MERTYAPTERALQPEPVLASYTALLGRYQLAPQGQLRLGFEFSIKLRELPLSPRRVILE